MVAQNLAVAVLSSGVTRKTARTIAREIAREAYQVDGALLIFGRPSQVRQDARFPLQEACRGPRCTTPS